MDRAKVIFGNPVSDRDYQKACRQKEKFRKKFGDDSGTDYYFAAEDNAVLAPIGVKNLVLTDKPGLKLQHGFRGAAPPVRQHRLKAQRKEIKSYKPSGCKKLMFKRSDLQKWILSSGRVIDSETILKEIQSGVRHKPRSITGK